MCRPLCMYCVLCKAAEAIVEDGRAPTNRVPRAGPTRHGLGHRRPAPVHPAPADIRHLWLTVDVSPPSASKALRQRHAHHPRSRPTHTRAHVPCRMWDLGRALSYWNSCCVLSCSRLPWTELRCPPPSAPPCSMPMDCTPPPLVVRPCSSPMHVIQGSSELVPGHFARDGIYC